MRELLRYIKIWLISFIIAIIVQILYQKYIGAMLAPRKAYHWDEIKEDLPFTILIAILFASGALYNFIQDRKNGI